MVPAAPFSSNLPAFCFRNIPSGFTRTPALGDVTKERSAGAGLGTAPGGAGCPQRCHSHPLRASGAHALKRAASCNLQWQAGAARDQAAIEDSAGMLKCGRARHKPELHGRHSASGNASQLETRAAQTAYRLPPPRESACGGCGENHPPEKHNVIDNNPATNPGQRPLRLLSPVAHAQGGGSAGRRSHCACARPKPGAGRRSLRGCQGDGNTTWRAEGPAGNGSAGLGDPQASAG